MSSEYWISHKDIVNHWYEEEEVVYNKEGRDKGSNGTKNEEPVPKANGYHCEATKVLQYDEDELFSLHLGSQG